MTDKTISPIEALASLKAELKRREAEVETIKEGWRVAEEQFRAALATAEQKVQDFKDEIDRSLGLSFEMTVQARRERVLALLHEDKTVGQIAKEVGVSGSTVSQDRYKLERQGLYPIPLKGPDDEETRRRNRRRAARRSETAAGRPEDQARHPHYQHGAQPPPHSQGRFLRRWPDRCRCQWPRAPGLAVRAQQSAGTLARLHSANVR